MLPLQYVGKFIQPKSMSLSACYVPGTCSKYRHNVMPSLTELVIPGEKEKQINVTKCQML